MEKTKQDTETTIESQFDVIAYTDGSYQERHKSGDLKGEKLKYPKASWAVLLLKKPEDTWLPIMDISGNIWAGQNRQVGGEVEAAIQAIHFCLEAKHESLLIRHDYTGIGNWPTNVWRANDPDALRLVKWSRGAAARGLRIVFQWVKGHSKDIMNEAADKLASEAYFTPVVPKLKDIDVLHPLR